MLWAFPCDVRVLGVAMLSVVAACSGGNKVIYRSTTQQPKDAGYSAPDGHITSDASTTGQSTVAVLPDGATAVVLPDGGLGIRLADGGIGVVGGASVLKLVCDKGAVVVSGSPTTLQCFIELGDGSHATNVVWIVNDTRIGSIGDDGVLHINGLVGGIIKVTAKIGTASISAEITVDVAISDNSGAVSAADMSKLAAGGSGGPAGVGPDGAFRWLYPYDQTVFPLGLPAPSLQFAGTCSGSMYLTLTAPHFFYEQFAKTTTPLRLVIPEDVWKGVTLTAGPSDPVTASVNELCAGAVTGPISESWLIAPGKMKGVVYYTTYASPKFGVVGAYRIPLGLQAEPLLRNYSCTVCHSVSANGEVLGTAQEWTGIPSNSGTFDLTTGSLPAPNIYFTDDGTMFAFPALTPDGKRALTSGPGGVQGMGKAPDSRFVDTSNGQLISAPSLGALVKDARTPSFSPDGKFVAFNNGDPGGQGHLAMMDYDGAQSPPLFSNLREIATDPIKALAWPSFIPDSGAVVYHEGDWFQTTDTRLADLRLVELPGNRVVPLAALNGYLPDGSLYLPWGDALEAHKNYQPSVMPRPIGGYYWVMFLSRRCYGNTISPGGTTEDFTGLMPGDPEKFQLPVRKKIWVAAVDLDYTGKADPSHPAFLLPGQEIRSGNSRPFVSLDPCRPLGASCESGVDCCDGFCRETGRDAQNNPILQCVPPPEGSCSNLDEACVTVADCCDPTNLCVLGRCVYQLPAIR